MAGYSLVPLARKDLDEIWTYTVGQWNEEQAERYIHQIEATIEAVADNPDLGRWCDEQARGTRIRGSPAVLGYCALAASGCCSLSDFNLHFDAGAKPVDDRHEAINSKSAKIRITNA